MWKERYQKLRRRTDGGDGQIIGSYTESAENTGTGYDFSVKSSNTGQLETQGMEVNNDVNVLIKDLINIANHSNVCNSVKFNPDVKDSLRLQGKLTKDMKDWEKVVLMSLNNMNRKERDDRKTSYVKYKLFKRDIYSLALVDNENLVRGTLMSSEFWDTIGEKMLEKSNARVSTAEKGGKGFKVLRKGEKMRFYWDGLDRVFEVEPIVIEGLNHALNFGIEFFRQQEVSISC